MFRFTLAILCVGFVLADHHEGDEVQPTEQVTSKTTTTETRTQSIPARKARWCTISDEEYQMCLIISSVLADHNIKPIVGCVERSSVEECFITIREGNADVITIDAGDILRAGKVFNMRPIVKEVYSDGSTGYPGIAVTKAEYTNLTLTNLRGARTCHTGVGRTAGWNIPIGYLLHSGQMESLGCKEHVKSAANFFRASCAPGAEIALNNPYNDDVSNLCDICAGDCGRSSDTEPYNGYSGALRCLVEGRGEVAFIKPATLEANLGEDRPDWAVDVKESDLRLLCKDGSRALINDFANCHISKGLSHTVMTSGTATDEEIESYQRLILKAAEAFSEVEKDFTLTMAVVEEDNYRDYLGGYGESFEGLQKCPDNTVRFCTISKQEQVKCHKMRDAFSMAGLRPNISCFPAYSYDDCIDQIAAGNADIVTLDGGDIYRAGKDHGLVPIMGEVYKESKQASYYAVAVVHKDAPFNITGLRGRRSCHTGIMKTSGWIMPAGFLAKNKYINASKQGDVCSVTAEIGNFFSNSCAPGAKSRKYDVYGDNPDSLCSLCRGKEDNFCARNNYEPFYGYSGAFRCLAEGGGEVAFVKHSTVRDNTWPNGREEWNERLKQRNFRLLCPDGSKMEPWKYRKCNLGKVPSHAVMTSGGKKKKDQVNIIQLLRKGVEKFRDDKRQGFKMFDSTDSQYIDDDGQLSQDLLFKDSAINITGLRVGKRNYEAYLGSTYMNALKTVNCLS